MRIAVIGAGPAGLTAAKQALARGHSVAIFEKYADLGGIWNPASGGAYQSVRMQTSARCFPFSDYAPSSIGEFPNVAEVHTYLRGYSDYFDVSQHIRYGEVVTEVKKSFGEWIITSSHGAKTKTEQVDRVIIANGELWVPKVLPSLSGTHGNTRVISVKEYYNADRLLDKKVLVVGGGVSGADIASELAESGCTVEWSVRSTALFLPRRCGDYNNDHLFSYIGRYAVAKMPRADYLQLLHKIMPDYMAAYKETKIYPFKGHNNAIHINDRIVEAVHQERVAVRSAFWKMDDDGTVHFQDGTVGQYDIVISCAGYEKVDYSFIDNFDRRDLFEHFFYQPDTTLAILNTPGDADAVGTACPYFELIAGWILRVFEGAVQLPGTDLMKRWCERAEGRSNKRYFYDCWLESIRIGLLSQQIPDPMSEFDDYWTLISSIPLSSNLHRSTLRHYPAAYDHLIDMDTLKSRLLTSLPLTSRKKLFAAKRITDVEFSNAERTPSVNVISLGLSAPAELIDASEPLVQIGSL